MLLRVYSSKRYLATAKLDSTITLTEDVNVDNAKLNMSVEEAIPNAINDVKMIAVDSLSTSNGYLQCGNTGAPTEEEESGNAKSAM